MIQSKSKGLFEEVWPSSDLWSTARIGLLREIKKKKNREMERTHWFQSRHKIKCVPCFFVFFYHHVLETARYSVVEKHNS